MSDFIREKLVRTRKEHWCWACRGTIPTRAIVLMNVFVDNGKIFTIHTCGVCDYMMRMGLCEELSYADDDLPEGFIADEYPDLLRRTRKEAKVKADEYIAWKKARA